MRKPNRFRIYTHTFLVKIQQSSASEQLLVWSVLWSWRGWTTATQHWPAAAVFYRTTAACAKLRRKNDYGITTRDHVTPALYRLQVAPAAGPLTDNNIQTMFLSAAHTHQTPPSYLKETETATANIASYSRLRSARSPHYELPSSTQAGWTEVLNCRPCCLELTGCFYIKWYGCKQF